MDRLAPDTQFGQYHIARFIGGGGMAQIYLAKTQGLAGFEKHLALKVINPEYANEERFVQMLIDEAKITVGLSHVNIAQVFDLGQCGGTYYIAMEFVDGKDVLELVNGLHAQGRRLPIEAVAYIGRQMCSGLHYAHNKRGPDGKPLGIVHRDISPQNIIVSRNGEVKVVDFGIAKAAGVSSKTQAGVIKGKVNYMAPEQAMGHKADRRSDIFATGVVMWEMLTAQMVYNGKNVGELVNAVRKADIPPPSTARREIPAQLDKIVLKAVAKRADDRYQSAHQLQVDLTKFLSATAPDYSGSDLAELVEDVVSPNKGASAIDEQFSRDDLHSIADHNSVIFEFDAAPSARLVVRTERGEQVVDLQDELIVGRAGQLAIPDARISRQHVRIFARGTDYMIEDLGSSNGTFVNDQRVTVPRPLRHGDKIRVGNAALVFLAPGEAKKAVAASGADVVHKLLVTADGETVERQLDDETELSYRVQIGAMSFEGSAGKLTRRDDGYWLEPEAARMPVTFKGAPALRPVRLGTGDGFEISGVTFRLASETRPFSVVTRKRDAK